MRGACCSLRCAMLGASLTTLCLQGEPCTACCLCVAPEYGLPPKSFYFIGAVVRVEALGGWTNADHFGSLYVVGVGGGGLTTANHGPGSHCHRP